MTDEEKLPLAIEEPPMGEEEQTPEGHEEVPDLQADFSRMQEENKALREQLSDLVKTFGQKPEPPPERRELPAERRQEPKGEVNFLEGVEVDRLFDDPSSVLNTLLNKVYQRGREAALEDLPTLVESHARQVVDVRLQADRFWKENSDLREYQDFVGVVANQVVNENPNWTLDQVYNETAKRTRERLAPILSAEKSSDTPPTNPALPDKRGGRRPPAQVKPLTEEEKTMEDMWKAFGG